MFKIVPTTEESGITKIVCPICGEKVPRVGLRKGSKVSGLTIRCRRCGKLLEVKTE